MYVYIYIYTMHIIHICHIIAIVLTYMYLHKLPSVSKCRKKLCLDGDGICPHQMRIFTEAGFPPNCVIAFPR